MITQDRNGNALPSTVDPGRLAWSARIAYTGGDYLTPANWTYYELPPSAIVQRSRNSVLDGSTWECRLTVLAEAVPELTDLQAYYQLEVDLVDDVGNAWPYHTGPIDSISDAYDDLQGAIVQTKEIASFGTLQRLKNARVNGFFWDGNSQAVSGGQVFTGYAEPVNVTVTTTGAAGTFTVPGSWHTVDATITGGTYPGIIVSANADFSAPYASPANYTVTATDGSQLALVFATAPAGTIYVKYWAVRYFAMRGYGITYPAYSGDPTFVRIPDGTMPAGSTETAPRRRLTDSFATFAAAGCTSTTIYVQDPQAYQNVFTSRLVAPAGTYQEILCYTAADGAEYFATISSTDAAGVITLGAAFVTPMGVANPVPEGAPLRIVTTEIEREYIADSSGARARFFTSSGLVTEYSRDSFAFDARAGVLVPQRGRHYDSATEGVYADGLRHVPSIKGTLGVNDASLESFVYRTFTDFPATDVTKFFRTADFVQGDFSGCYVKAYSAANTTWDAVLREVTDLAAAPNVFVHDQPDGRLRVGAYTQAITPSATLDLLTAVNVEAQPEPMTAVAVKSITSEPVNITGQCRNLVTNTSGTLNNPAYLFDGDKSSSTTWAANLATNVVTIDLILPYLPAEVFPILHSLVVYPGTTLGAISVKVTKTTRAGVSNTRYVRGFGYAIQEASKPVTVAGQLLEEAMFILGLDSSSLFKIVIEGRPNDGVGVAAQFSATEVQLLATVQAAWVARMNDVTTSAPTGYTTANQQGFGSIWWQRTVSRPVSERYVPTTYLRRVIPGYDAADTYRFDRLQVIEMEQITATECRRYAEAFMDEYMRLGRTYQVQAVLDPRIDLGDTVTIQLDDGQTLDLFVWSISDGGAASDLTASYTLIDYSA
ncbi:MAG: hypothetical protein EBX40_00125 [Gammaproteobacteria bacterium]|nr:hypothetical protein [Gammaproteobacteria bacterium]